MRYTALRTLDQMYFLVDRFAASEVRVTPTGRVIYGKWKAKRVTVPRATRIMEGPVYSIIRVGPVYLGDLLATTFFDVKGEYTVQWKDPYIQDLSTIVVTDADGATIPLNADGKNAFIRAEALERLELESRNNAVEKAQQARLQAEQGRSKAAADKAAQREEAKKQRRLQNEQLAADKATRRVLREAAAEKRRFLQQTEQDEKLVKRAMAQERAARAREKAEQSAAVKIQRRMEWQKRQDTAEAERQARLARIRKEYEDAAEIRRAKREVAVGIRRSKKTVAAKIQPDAIESVPTAAIVPTADTDELSFLTPKQRHDLDVIRRDYPELKEFDTLRIAHMLVRLNSRNSTVATLFQRQKERLQMEWSIRYRGDSGSSRPTYVRDTRLQRIFDIVRCDQLHLEALRYGVAIDPEIDPITEREMRLYGISTTTFIPVEEEEENEYDDSETV